MKHIIVAVCSLVLVTATFPVAHDVEVLNTKLKQKIKQQTEQTARELDCLSKNIYNEARGEPVDGMVAVAYVTLTRARKKAKSVCDVVYQSAKVRGRMIYQFSWVGLKHLRPIEQRSLEISKRVAMNCWFRRFVDPTKGADHYHERHIKPKWANKKMQTAKIGNHIFYKLDQRKTS